MRNKLRKEIYKRGYTIESFADVSGVSSVGLHIILRGKYKTVKGYTIYNIAKGLDMTYEEVEELINEE